MASDSRRFSLKGKLALSLFVSALAGAVLTGLASRLAEPWWVSSAVAMLLLVPLVLWAAQVLVAPLRELLRALTAALASFRDGDFSGSIRAVRGDELGDLIEAHNELGGVLRAERHDLVQRELMLDTVVQNTPTALVLCDADDHIVYANLAARQQFNAGRKLEGLSFAAVLDECDPAVRTAVSARQDAIFSVALEGAEESFHLAQRAFTLRGRPHRLFLFRRLTRELGRQEVATWKKAIRVISHELNNALAPISSLAHSGRELSRLGDRDRLERVFDTIEDRARYLHAFLQGYAAFAKLPLPRPESVRWQPFLAELASIGWRNRQGLADAGNQFHYYRLTADNRILWGGYDAVYYNGGRISAARDANPATFARLAEHFFQTFPQLAGLDFTHAWGGVVDTCSRFCVFTGTAHGGRLAYAAGYTGLGVGAARFGANTMLDLLHGEQTERTSLAMMRTRPVPFPPEPARSAVIQLTRASIARADRSDGRRDLWLRTLDRLGVGYDS